MSKDAWLDALRTEPSGSFKTRVRERLRAQEPADSNVGWARRALVAAAAVVAFALVVSVPAVRASAAQFLSLFRVVNFVPVAVDANRLDRLTAENLEIGTLIGEHVEILADPGPPVNVSFAEAEQAAGMTLAVPQWLPENTTVLETAVVGERVARVTASGQRLQQVMDALGINDLTAPPGLDGEVVNLRVPPVVMIRYEHGKRRSRLLQARTPQLTLPAGVNVAALGEIGLRILGLAPAEAEQFAEAIDWNTTLIVPVPPTAQSFRQVTINGRLGIHIEHQPAGQSQTHVVLWSTGERVFGLVSIAHLEDVMAMANTIR